MTIQKNTNKTHHFRDKMCSNVIIHHNKKIIQRISEFLTELEEVENKNYYMLKGKYKTKEVMLIATGMGAGNTGIVVDQVISQGAETIFKFGTFGALQEKIRIGDIYLPQGAIRSEGLTDAYAPIYFPATPDMGLYLDVIKEAKRLKIKIKNEGIIHSVNIYSPYYSDTFNQLKYSSEKYQSLGAIGVEMETSTAFICSAVKQTKCVAILICNREWSIQKEYKEGKKVHWDKHQQEKKKDEATRNGIKLMLEAISNSTQ